MSIMYAQMGLAVGQALLGAQSAKVEARLEDATRKFRNTMSALSAASSYNTLTDNEISLRDSALRAAEAIQLDTLQARASAENSAADAGVRGGAVLATMTGIARRGLQAKQSLHTRLMQQGQQNRAARKDVAMAQVYNKDITVAFRPSSTAALLGLGANMIDIFDSHQPKGQTALDRAASWTSGLGSSA